MLRHSTAHVMARRCRSCVLTPSWGRPVHHGRVLLRLRASRPFTPEDCRAARESMLKIVDRNQIFRRRCVTEEEAGAEMAGEPYKLELIDLAGGPGSGAVGGPRKRVRPLEVGGGKLTVHDNVDRKSGDVVWRDLCRGPHLPDTKHMATATRSCAPPPRIGAATRRTSSCSSTAPPGPPRTS
ncbi:hypothetical protein QJS66_04350 [Kocuria rhizophila]|nr:hypothetical protein QJS66_04350 [Kocuria rhizophila]